MPTHIIYPVRYISVPATVDGKGGSRLVLAGGSNATASSAEQGGIRTLTLGVVDAPVFPGVVKSDGLVVPKTSGKGIKVDTASPTFGWRDMLGALHARQAAGATVPTWSELRTGVYSWKWANTGVEQSLFVEFHVPHDYAPGTDLFIHAHWAQDTVDTGGPAGVPGQVEWRFDVSYADGHGIPGGAADPFIAPKTATVQQQGSTTQYGHMIAEVAITNAGGDATHLDKDTITVDGILIVRVYRDSSWNGDTLNQVPFLAGFVDIHYQSTGMGTKNRAPNFYGA